MRKRLTNRVILVELELQWILDVKTKASRGRVDEGALVVRGDSWRG